MDFQLENLFDHERHQSHGAGSFDGVDQGSLVSRAGAMPFRGIDFSLRVHESAEHVGFLVVDFFDFFFAEKTRFLFHMDYQLEFII